MLLQSDTTEALPSSGPIDDMSISASTAAAAAASVADGLGVVVAAAVTIVNIIPSSFYVLLLLATGCWMLAAALPSSDSHTNSQDHKIACAIMEIFPFEFRRRMSLEANGTKRTWNGRLPEDVIFTRICIESCAKRTKEEFQLTKNMHIHTTYYYTYLLVSKL
jgi:hypothetical protein